MPDLTYTAFTQHLRKMFDFSGFNGTNLPLMSNEEPTVYDEKQDYQPQYSKLSVGKPVSHSSLLTEALSSPELAPVDRYRREPQGIPSWSLSGASTAELTSDGGLSSSSHSPIPTPPEMLHTFRRLLQSNRPSTPKLDGKNHAGLVQVVGGDGAIEGLTRRRCIRFACNPEPPSRKGSTDDYFDERPAATLRVSHENPAQSRPILPPGSQASQQLPRTLAKDSSIAKSNMNPRISPIPAPDSMKSAMRFHEFASSCEETESWMIQVPDKSRLLRVDGVLAKEREIRKLSEEVEAEARQEKEDEEELDGMDDDEEDDDEEDELADEEGEIGEEDDEIGEDGTSGYLSGDESDNEEGFASDSDESDGSFFSGPRHLIPMKFSPSCRRNVIPSPTYLLAGVSTHLDQHPEMQLPDSTDFVCGTFDEDRALEDAYACALVEQKRAKYGITPQDIDPSFPSSESDSEEECRIQSPRSPDQLRARGRVNLSEEEVVRGRGLHSILTGRQCPNEGKIRFNSPAPKRRDHVPAAPKNQFVSPPATQQGFRVSPPARRNSHDLSPRLAMSRRGTRALSPPPPVRKFSHLSFTRGHIERTKSLPKTTKLSLRSFGNNTEGMSSNENAGIRTRGAIDIVKGLEKKRERRHNRWARQRDSSPKKGEGVEKMRELGLMLGKGKQAQWMISV